MSNSNKTILTVVAALAIILVLLLANAGSCSRTGGMGGSAGAGGATSATTSTSAASSSPSAAVQAAPSTSASASSAPSSASASTPAPASSSSQASSSASQQVTIDQALTTVRATQAQVGANVRSAQSASLVSASQAYGELSSRGLGGVTLSADFDASGAYVGAVDIQSASSEAYPAYQGLYQSSNDVYWLLYMNEGKLYASPVATSSAKIQRDVVFAESGTVTQYDALSNQFSDFTRQDLEAAGTHAVQVAAIDKATLDAYSAAQIEAM